MTQAQLDNELDVLICKELQMDLEDLKEVSLPLVQRLRRTILGEVLNELEGI